MTYDILIIDDEKDICALLSGVLQDEGYQTSEARSIAQARTLLTSRLPHLILLDIWLQGSDIDGIEYLQELQKHYPQIPVVMISGHGNIETAVEAMKKGAIDFIQKPIKLDHLLVVVEKALLHRKLVEENTQLKKRSLPIDELIGSSHEVQKITHLINKIAPTASRVCIFGPSGSGKEVAAYMIHQKSPRQAGPFIVTNCAILDPDHFEEELFGTEKSATQRLGILEKAHNGTLFLDEVADMPYLTQGKFVRILHEKSFMRVGGTKAVEVDVRVIASSSKELKYEVSEGRFREDLYYRLNVVSLELPPLKNRRDDILPLARYFIESLSKSGQYPLKKISPEVEVLLHSYDWPGNVRELRNVVERMLIMSSPQASEPIGIEALSPELKSLKSLPGDEDAHGLAPFLSLPLKEARDQFEKIYLEQQIKRFSGSVTKTSEFVGMERAALHRKIKQLNVKE